MGLIDDQVKGWLKEKFLASRSYSPETQGGPDDIEILSVDQYWSCGCYSEYTRDDTFMMAAQIKGADGREFTWSYGVWADIPSFIEELYEYINNNECPYEDEVDW